MLNSLKAAFETLNKGGDKLRKQLAELREQETALRDERAALLAQPLTRADYAAVMCAQIDLKANTERAAFTRHFEQGARGDGAMSATVQTAVDAKGLSRFPLHEQGRRLPMFGFLSAQKMPTAHVPHDAAFFLFRDAICKAITSAIEAIEEWPWPDAKPLAETLTRIEAIDADLVNVIAKADALREQAAELGIDVSAPTPPPAPEPASLVSDYVPTREHGYQPPKASTALRALGT